MLRKTEKVAEFLEQQRAQKQQRKAIELQV